MVKLEGVAKIGILAHGVGGWLWLLATSKYPDC